MALTFTASSTTQRVTLASMPVNLQQGVALMWITFTDVANVLRNVFALTTPQGFSMNQRAPDGTALLGIWGRSTTNTTVQSPTGTCVTGKPICLALMYDHGAVTLSLWSGDGATPLTDVSTAFAAGSGTHDDTGAAWHLGHLTAAVSGMIIHAWALHSGVFTIRDLRQWQMNPTPTAMRGCLAFYRPGLGGSATVFDESGNQRHGAITGAVPSGELAPWRPGRRVWRPRGVAVGGIRSRPVLVSQAVSRATNW